MTPMKIGIVGAGTVGSVLAACLVSTGQSVVLVEPVVKRRQQIQQQGLCVCGTQEVRVPSPQLVASLDELAECPIQLLFISLKIPVLRREIASVASFLSKGADVVLAQNGLGNEELFVPYNRPEQLFRMVINFAGNLREDGIVQSTFFLPPNYVGPIHPSSVSRSIEIAHLLSEANLPTAVDPTIQNDVWKKVLLNAAMSPVCALTQQQMVQAMNDSHTVNLIEALLREGILVAHRKGIDLGEAFFAEAMQYLRKAGPHRPSLWIDLQHQQRSEIDYLNGKISEYGKQVGIPTPHHDTIYALIKGYESVFLSPSQEKT